MVILKTQESKKKSSLMKPKEEEGSIKLKKKNRTNLKK